MKQLFLPWVCIVLEYSVLVLPAAAQPATLKVAIHPLQALVAEQRTVTEIEQQLREQVERLPGIELLTATATKACLALTSEEVGCSSNACLAKLASNCEVDRMVYGTVAVLGKSNIVDLKLVDSRSGEQTERQSISLAVDAEQRARQIETLAIRLIRPGSYVGSLTVVVAQSQATVFLDGKKVGVSPIVEIQDLRPGEHALKILHPDFREYSGFVTVQFGKRARIEVMLSADPLEQPVVVEDAAEPVAAPDLVTGAELPITPVTPVQPDDQANAAEMDRSPLLIGGFGGLAAGGLLLVGAVVSYAIAYPTAEEANRLVLDNGAVTDAERYTELAGQAVTAWGVGVGLTAAGIALAVIGGGILIWDLGQGD